MRHPIPTIASSTLILLLSAGARAEPPEAEWKEPSGAGVGLGFGQGVWGRQYGTQVHVRVPFGDHFALQLRGLAIQDIQADPYRMDLGGRVGLQGGTRPLLNILRVYGSGGVQVITPITGPSRRRPKVGFGGEFGLEGFLYSGLSVFIEIGGNGFIESTYGSGGTAIAGLNFYI